MVRLPETLLHIFHCSKIFVSFMVYQHMSRYSYNHISSTSISASSSAYRKVSASITSHSPLLRDEQNHSMLNLKAYAVW